MASDGGSADTLLKCARDGVATRLQCRECQTPICPKCYVRTAVGLRCQTCAADAVPTVAASERSPRWPVMAVIAVVVALVVAGGGWIATRGGDGASGEVDIGEGAVRTVDPVTIGTAELPNGASWTLVARREGRICITLTISTASPSPEQCVRPPGNRTMTLITRRPVNGPGGTAFISLGMTSGLVERIRVAPEGVLGTWEAPIMGADSGIGYRFFLIDTSDNVAMNLTPIGTNGAELGRYPLPPLVMAPPRR